MFPKMNPKQMKKMMRQMGMKMEELPASEVVIRLADVDLVIKNPSVSVVEVQGQKTYQIVGGEESAGSTDEKLSENDVDMVASQAGVSKEDARQALEDTDGDLAAAIIALTKS